MERGEYGPRPEGEAPEPAGVDQNTAGEAPEPAGVDQNTAGEAPEPAGVDQDTAGEAPDAAGSAAIFEAEAGSAAEGEPMAPAEVFQEHFPAGEINDIELADLPDTVTERIYGLASLYLSPEKFEPEGFRHLRRIEHADGGQTYLASYEKDYGQAGGGVEESTYLIDLNEEGDYSGYGEVRKSLSSDSDYFMDKPFVGYTRTEKGQAKKGLGLRRMAMMNAVSRMLYDQPLYSDTVQSDEAKRLWEALVKQGDAVKFKEGDHDRYVFAE